MFLGVEIHDIFNKYAQFYVIHCALVGHGPNLLSELVL
jgi:hypothetical protein